MQNSILAAALALVASAAPDFDESPKHYEEVFTIDGVLKSYWAHWWTRQSDTQYTFYETNTIQLEEDNVCSTNCEIQFYFCYGTEKMSFEPCQLYSVSAVTPMQTQAVFYNFNTSKELVNSTREDPPASYLFGVDLDQDISMKAIMTQYEN